MIDGDKVGKSRRVGWVLVQATGGQEGGFEMESILKRFAHKGSSRPRCGLDDDICYWAMVCVWKTKSDDGDSRVGWSGGSGGVHFSIRNAFFESEWNADLFRCLRLRLWRCVSLARR